MTNFEEEIAKRDARIAELEAENRVLEQEISQQPSAGVACALMSALEGIVHDQRVPNEVSQECAAVLIEARRPNPCRAQAVPDGWVMVPAVATDHMTWVGQSMRHGTEISIGSIYCAMLAAAPSAKKESGH